MRRLLSWFLGFPLAVVLIAFAVANRASVQVSFDPFSQAEPFAAVSLPLWTLLFIGIFLGLVAGWAGAWLNQGKWRRTARDVRTEATALRAENSRLHREREAREAALAERRSLDEI
jgi:NhaP-type Na+/H+ or K+/H+ antiporter